MAYFPCSRGHANPHGRNSNVYVAWGRSSDFKRYRLRLCAIHFLEAQDHLAEFEVNPENGTVGGDGRSSTHCISCLEPVDEVGWQIFATCYPTHNERKDYWAQLHVGHQLPAVLLEET